jgi:hypothetical protein
MEGGEGGRGIPSTGPAPLGNIQRHAMNAASLAVAVFTGDERVKINVRYN